MSDGQPLPTAIHERGWLRRLVAEPLLHFVLLGGMLFALYLGVNDTPEVSSPNRIVVDKVQLQSILTAFERTWLRAPTAGELDGLIREHVKEEVLYREALALGLDSDDLIIRRRLRQKMEFLNADLIEPPTPTDADLQTYLDANSASYREAERHDFIQVFVNRGDDQGDAQQRASRLLAQLPDPATAAPPVTTLGDVSMLPGEMMQADAHDIGRVFGDDFAAQLSAVPLNRWSGPYRSTYGLHLVYVSARTAAREAQLDEVRAAVTRDWAAAQRHEANERFYSALLERYKVEVIPFDLVSGDTLTVNQR